MPRLDVVRDVLAVLAAPSRTKRSFLEASQRLSRSSQSIQDTRIGESRSDERPGVLGIRIQSLAEGQQGLEELRQGHVAPSAEGMKVLTDDSARLANGVRVDICDEAVPPTLHGDPTPPEASLDVATPACFRSQERPEYVVRTRPSWRDREITFSGRHPLPRFRHPEILKVLRLSCVQRVRPVHVALRVSKVQEHDTVSLPGAQSLFGVHHSPAVVAQVHWSVKRPPVLRRVHADVLELLAAWGAAGAIGPRTRGAFVSTSLLDFLDALRPPYPVELLHRDPSHRLDVRLASVQRAGGFVDVVEGQQTRWRHRRRGEHRAVLLDLVRRAPQWAQGIPGVGRGRRRQQHRQALHGRPRHGRGAVREYPGGQRQKQVAEGRDGDGATRVSTVVVEELSGRLGVDHARHHAQLPHQPEEAPEPQAPPRNQQHAPEASRRQVHHGMLRRWQIPERRQRVGPPEKESGLAQQAEELWLERQLAFHMAGAARLVDARLQKH
eukprot:scaffold736_cov254-Pinguiococcus_pyrenoidosus.AAC.7